MKETGWRRFRRMVLGIMTALLLTGQPAGAQLSRLTFGKYRIVSIKPLSFRSARGTVEVDVRCDTTTFLMHGISGRVYRNGEPFVQGTCSDVQVSRGSSTVSATGTVSLCEGVTLWNVLGCLVGFDIEEFTGDLDMTITDIKGNRRQYRKQGVSAAAVLRNRKHKK